MRKQELCLQVIQQLLRADDGARLYPKFTLLARQVKGNRRSRKVKDTRLKDQAQPVSCLSGSVRVKAFNLLRTVKEDFAKCHAHRAEDGGLVAIIFKPRRQAELRPEFRNIECHRWCIGERVKAQCGHAVSRLVPLDAVLEDPLTLIILSTKQETIYLVGAENKEPVQGLLGVTTKHYIITLNNFQSAVFETRPDLLV